MIHQVATWMYDEWLSSNPAASVDRMVSILSERAEASHIPLTWVALSPEGVPIGVVSLQASDLKTRSDLTPWLAGLYVVPSERQRGVGRALCEHVLAEARKLGYTAVYLCTQGHESWYARQGWVVIASESRHGDEVTVMEFRD